VPAQEDVVPEAAKVVVPNRRAAVHQPEGPGSAGTLWGLPFDIDEARLIVLPVPWEATASYGEGTARGPQAVLEASVQVDLYDSERPRALEQGIALAPVSEFFEEQAARTRREAKRLIERLSRGGDFDEAVWKEVNRACDAMVRTVKADSERYLEKGKLVAVLGGDHSVPLGLMQALAERHESFGILHIDAHCDLRDAYEGFVHSHASIMRNAIRLESVTRLVQVGVRDYSEEELETVRRSRGRIVLFDDRSVSKRQFAGESWESIAEEMVAELPRDVYVSFDIDGLDPSLCPHTGTPVPGGLGFEQALFLVERVPASGRRIIGFDLCEVAPASDPADEWDANVGARVLYRLSCATISDEVNEE
jgi:agmatinase